MKIKFSSIPFLIIIVSVPFFSQQRFHINLNNRENDLFTVTLIPENLSAENNIFQFASTAPGTYQRMDIGKYVKSFKAYDENESEIETKHESVNQWSISNPVKVKKIIYEVEDTWDAVVDSNYIHRMCGSTISDDNVLINGQCVFGYFHGMQSYPIVVKIDYPSDWMIGTALQLNDAGYYEAKSYDYIVDSPILLGKLTQDSIIISDTKVNVYTYSKTGLIKSSHILSSVTDVLNAVDDFTDGLPVDHYTFLFHFEDVTNGAWEHSYSSVYVYREDTLTNQFLNSIRDIVSHEFFHIVTPLNIHSELVEEFNFEKPVMSQHLWLYEGVTEWASDILLLRDSVTSLDEYLYKFQLKLANADNYDKSISLTTLGINSTELSNQYPNIYEKGAIVGALLDIRLLELSQGKQGLREVINKLSESYGPDESFSEENFFNEFADLTNPEIKYFFDNYIKGADPLPVKEYFEKLGIEYSEEGYPDSSQLSLGVSIGYNGKFIILNVGKESPNYNAIQAGDLIEKIEDDTLTLNNVQTILHRINTTKKIGERLKITILRDDKPFDVELILSPRRIKHSFSINENATKEQIELRNAWMRNL
ncbi:MAG TPA: PDZ domain-containing protein [Ignavibacteriaceae bacterium]|nr:PDZ domain-containing protein [Ignavibacteriaceae bacterium]